MKKEGKGEEKEKWGGEEGKRGREGVPHLVIPALRSYPTRTLYHRHCFALHVLLGGEPHGIYYF